MTVPMPHHQFTADKYEQMIAVGILTKYDHVELIRGEISAMHPISPPHAFCSMMFSNLLISTMPDEVLVTVRGPIRLSDDSVPQPDIALVRFARYIHAYPKANDVHMVVEIADMTLQHERETKVPLFASVGIPETWLVDLNSNHIERHSEPTAYGYRQITQFGHGDTIVSLTVPEAVISVDAVLGLDV